MKSILMSALIWLALTAVASAATGDALFIQGDNVNVRQAPDLGAPVARQTDTSFAAMIYAAAAIINSR